MTQILITADQLKVHNENLMITTIEDMAAFKEITIKISETPLDIQYIFEGVEKKMQILTINRVPNFCFDVYFLDQIYYEIGEAMIRESIDKTEYADEMRADEERGN